MTLLEEFGSYEGWCEAHIQYLNTIMVDNAGNEYKLLGFSQDEHDFYWLCEDGNGKKVQVSAVIWLCPKRKEDLK